MFSIADIDTSSEQQVLDPEDEESSEGEADDEETSPSYPIRTSITITKVHSHFFRLIAVMLMLYGNSLLVFVAH